MTKDEFVRAAYKSGYCSKKIAEEYCEGKDTLTEDDFLAVYRLQESRAYKNPGHPLSGGGYIRKRYFRDGGSEDNR